MKKNILHLLLLLASFDIWGQHRSKKNNPQLIAILDTIYNADQIDRVNMTGVQKQYGLQSTQVDSLWKKINVQDSINLIKVKKIISTHGWPGPDKVGEQGARAIFLVIQHADSLTQVTYLPLLREAVKKGKARPQHLALLEDRILTKQGKKQIYGSQLTQSGSERKSVFFPIADEANVNKRRAAVGLEPIEDYAKRFGIIYVPPAAPIQKKK
ncbi:DUF6624 domain-containing protein [Niabella sp. 22666]|uniref:DUF6624 domain-containing protein n=1 Tax=Niabella sp. 22666 TaxID=3453954 RepID=UPI003F864E66